MQRVLFSAVVGTLFLVPVATATLLLIFPGYVREIPLWFWVIWLLISVLLTFNAPALADWVTPPQRGIHQAMAYAKWATLLGVINIGAGMAALLFLMSSKPTG
jgi:hypothetical protein